MYPQLAPALNDLHREALRSAARRDRLAVAARRAARARRIG
ncbi:MAG TPA: hypothetical protein VHV76_15725 [Mycobacteriales bacterium]|nr:hypothetical protein [Mycobacteriales bacterium]